MNVKQLVKAVWRRKNWVLTNISPGKAINIANATKDFALKREKLSAIPITLKIDISPLCNLRCTTCVHADAESIPMLEGQEFDKSHKMSVEDFSKIIDQVKGKATSVSLYYLGDPLAHPDLDAICRVAADADLEVHVSSNFSFGLNDDRLRRMVNSGLSHLTVCVDGLSQEKYERTRIGGSIERVLSNLERICKIRKDEGRQHPLIEVQYIKYQHNLDEIDAAEKLCQDYGVDQFSAFWGQLDNYTDRLPSQFEIRGPKEAGTFPICYWPWFSTVIKWNGDVVPCCTHRHATQYVPGADMRTLGNVFETSLEEVWNSEKYQQARRLVADPERIETEPELKSTFCADCPVIFLSNSNKARIFGDKYDWEDFFELNQRGKPVRRYDSAIEFRKAHETSPAAPEHEPDDPTVANMDD